LNAKGNSYKIFDSNQLIVDTPSQDAHETPRLNTNDVNPDGTGGRTSTTPVVQKSEADPTRPAVNTGTPSGTTPATTNDKTVKESKNVLDSKQEKDKDSKVDEKKEEAKSDSTKSSAGSSFDEYSREIVMDQTKDAEETDGKLLAHERSLKAATGPTLNPTAYANAGRGIQPITKLNSWASLHDDAWRFLIGGETIANLQGPYFMTPEEVYDFQRLKNAWNKETDDVKRAAMLNELVDKHYRNYASRINLIDMILSDVTKLKDKKMSAGDFASKYNLSYFTAYTLGNNSAFMYERVRAQLVEGDPRWSTLPVDYQEAIATMVDKGGSGGRAAEAETPAPARAPEPGPKPKDAPTTIPPAAGQKPPPAGQKPSPAGSDKPPPKPPTGDPTAPPTTPPETVTVEMPTSDKSTWKTKLTQGMLLKGVLELLNEGAPLISIYKYIKMAGAGSSVAGAMTAGGTAGAALALPAPVLYILTLMANGYSAYAVAELVHEHLNIGEGGLFKNKEEQDLFEEIRRKSATVGGTMTEMARDIPTPEAPVTEESFLSSLTSYWTSTFGSTEAPTGAKTKTTETPQTGARTSTTTGAPTSTPKPRKTRPPPMTFPPQETQAPDPFKAWAPKQIEVDDASEPLLRPSFYEGGSEFVTSINHDVHAQTIDELMWQSFKNYQWEVNQTRENPLWGQQLAEEAARFASPLINEELLPEQSVEAEQEIRYAKSNLLAFDIKLPGSHDTFMDAVPLDGEVNVGDSREQRVRQTEKEFRDVDLEDWFSMSDNNPLKKFTATEGTQLPDSERARPGSISSYWWDSGLRQNQFIFQTRS
jgi:hypothetical protein